MKWSAWYLTRGDVIGILFVVFILCLVAFRFYLFHPSFGPNAGAAGFGPEWICTANARGDPICIKKLGR